MSQPLTKEQMTAAIKEGIASFLDAADSEMKDKVWDELIPEGAVLSDEDDQLMQALFDCCFEDVKVELKQALENEP